MTVCCIQEFATTLLRSGVLRHQPAGGGLIRPVLYRVPLQIGLRINISNRSIYEFAKACSQHCCSGSPHIDLGSSGLRRIVIRV